MEVTTTGWLSRLGGSIKGVLFGGLMFLAGFPILFKNEGCAVDEYRAYTEGRSSVQKTTADKVDPASNGKLVHMVAKADTTDELTDDRFQVKQQAIKLRRVAEMYQWEEEKHEETEKQTGGSTKTKTWYTYEKVWADHAISSSGFNDTTHVNPEMKFHGETWDAKDVTFGAFRLSPGLISKINNYEKLPVGEEDLAKAENLGVNAIVSGDGFYLSESTAPQPSNPELGDIRIHYEVVRPSTVSIMAAQLNDTFEPYDTGVSSTKIEMLTLGESSAENMFKAAEEGVAMRTWAIRFGGFMCMFIGLAMIMAPLAVLADVLPILGNFVQMGTTVVAGVIAAGCALITIAVAWVFYRPLLGIALLVVAALLIGGIIYLAKKKGSAAAADPMAS